jgi:two-component system LytT family response regulator
VLGQGPISRLFVRSGLALVPLAVDRVAWFTADGDYVVAHAERARHLVHLSLSRLEARLDPRRFVRIHRATIVNTTYVHELFPAVDGGVVVRLRDERKTELSVARDRVRELKERLGI